MFKTWVRLALALFFRRIEVEARYCVPAVGPVLFVANHTNALVDPLVLASAVRRQVTFTAKNTLMQKPLLNWIIRALGVVTFHRQQDVGRGADLRQNIRSLKRCRAILAEGGAICIFPEGVSHSDPKLRRFRPGPAKIALDFVRRDGNPGGLRIVPVGLLFAEKDRFRSDVWLRFGAPLDLARWLEEHPGADAEELTAELERRVLTLTLNYQTRRESAILTWAAEIVATGAKMPGPLGAEERPAAERFRLLARLQAGYRTLVEREPELVEALSRRIGRYRAELKRAGISPDEAHLPLHFGRAALFLVRELELVLVGAPLALLGALTHTVPYFTVRGIAKAFSKDKDQWASNVVLPGLVIFPLWYFILLLAAWWFLPPLWAVLFSVAVPYCGYYAVLYGDRLWRVGRRARTFVRFLLHPAEQQRLAGEGRAIVAEIRALAARLESPPAHLDAELDAGSRSSLFTATAADLEAQFRDDLTALRNIVDGLERLEADWTECKAAIGVRQRGYFTPPEDDRVRQLLLAYRNYRLALYEILDRYLDYEELPAGRDQVRAFTIAYAAGLTLYAKSLRLIAAYERDPLVRAKLNEADPKFGLAAGFFDEILRAYTSLYNYRLLAQAGRFYRRNRRAVRAAWGSSGDGRWLAEIIRRHRIVARRTFWQVFSRRLHYDWRAVARWIFRPVRSTEYSLRAFVGSTLATCHTTPWYEPALDAAILDELRTQLQPGDVLQIRAERKLTTAVLPGFWSHAAIHIGGRADLEQLGIGNDPRVRKWWDQLAIDGGKYGYVIEATAPGVLIQPLEKCLHADHVVVLRPNVGQPERQAALLEAFSHVGKPYDFEFNFNVTTRLVCTELVYRSYHGRGKIEFSLIKRLGRYTLSCDDITRWLVEGWQAEDRCSESPFDVISLVLRAVDGQAYFVSPTALRDTLLAIQGGLRPSSVPRIQFQSL